MNGGDSNIAFGSGASISGGSNNIVLSQYAASFGGENGVAQGYGSVIIGGSTGTGATDSVAIGPSSVVTVWRGTAIGYQSTTDEQGTIAFGHDAGDVSGYTVTWQQRTDTDADGNIVKNDDGTTNDYTKAPTVTENTYTSAAYNRLVKVADGKSAHDVATVGQTVELVAGDHVKVENDTTATNGIGQQRKKISIVADGTVTENDTGLVTGGTVATALNSEATARQSADTALTNQIQTLSDQAVTYNADKSKVQLAGTNGTRLTNLQEGELSTTSTDAVSGKQLYATNQNITTLQSTVAQKADKTDVYTKTEVDSQVSNLNTNLAGKADTNLSNLTDAGKTAVKDIMKTDLSQKADKADVYMKTETYNRTEVDDKVNVLTNDLAGKADTSLSNLTDAGKAAVKDIMQSDLDKKANQSDVYTKTEIDSQVSSLNTNLAGKADASLSNLTDAGKTAVKDIMKTDLDKKANQADVYTKTEVDSQVSRLNTNLVGKADASLSNLTDAGKSTVKGIMKDDLAQKADKSTVYTKDETYNRGEIDGKVSGLTTDIAGKADTSLSNLTDAGKTAVKGIMKDDLAQKADKSTVYTKAETYNRTEIDGKVSGLTTDIAGKADTSLSNLTDAGKATVKGIMKDDLAQKADKSTVYTKDETYNRGEIDGKVSGLTTDIAGKADTSLSNLTDAGKAAVKGIMKDDLAQKADKSAVYTKTETYNRTEIDGKVSNLTTDIAGKADTSLSNLTDAGKATVKGIMKDDLAQKADKSTVYTKDETYNRGEIDGKVSGLTTDMAGKADTSLSNLTDAGKTAVKDIMKDDLAQKVDKSAVNLSADDVKNWQDKLGNGNIARGDHGLISGGRVFEALQGVGNYGLVKSDGKVVSIAKDDTATVIDVSGAGTNRVITGVKTDVRDPSSAANVAYVNGNTQQIYQDMNHAYGSLRNDISRAAASSNALAALKPMEFDSDDKLQFGIGYGHYHNANAAAVGAFYQPDENCMMNLGASLGNGDPGISAGITIKFGPGGSGAPTLSKKQMAQIIQKQSAQLDEQSKEIESLKKANEEMREQFKAIMDKLNK